MPIEKSQPFIFCSQQAEASDHSSPAMIFEGYIAQVNENELKELARIANNVANNINQIARRANVTNKVYKEDIEEVESLAGQIIDPLLFLQTKVLQLKR